MLLYIIERVDAPTFVSAFVAWGAWQLRDLLPQSIVYGIIAVVSIWYFKLLATAISCESRLAGLGARAPSYRSWTPYNLGLIYNAVWHMLRHRNHDFWWAMFDYAKKGRQNDQWTVEAITMGERIIFTADEENIKAILATQFAAYGKGPQFRKEWKPFLGLSMLAVKDKTMARPGLTKLYRYLHN